MVAMYNGQPVIVPDDYLVHHGILGMKWGVRRYQNKDGSYTKKGLERYRRSEDKYKAANDTYQEAKTLKKSGEISDDLVKRAKKNRRDAKRQLSRDYDKLKTDKLADEGKEIVKSGKGIIANTMDSRVKQALVGVGSITAASIVGSALAQRGATLVGRYGSVNLGTAAAKALVAAGVVAMAGIGAKTELDNRRIRSYYNH